MWESYEIIENLKNYIEILKNYMKNSEKNFHQGYIQTLLNDDLIIVETSRLYYFVMNKQPYDWFILEVT